MNTVRIMVTGATGYVGSRLVTALLEKGHDVVVASRDPDRLTDFGWYDFVTAVALDAHDRTSAAAALTETGPVDVVYYLVHGIGQPDFRDADNRAAVDAFYKAAIAAGGTDNGPPGVRPHYHKDYYGAFVLDPDGHNIEACCHLPEG